MAKKYTLKITMDQITDGEADGETLHLDHSADLDVHLIKTEVFTEEMTEAVKRATKRLIKMARDAASGQKPQKR